MKKIYLLLVLIAGFAFKPVTVKAQLKIDTALLVSAYTQSGYIFEGVVQNICTYEDQSTGNLYTSNTIQITKIFKGNLQCGTVNIITLGGVLAGYEMNVSDEIQFNVGVTGVFLCNASAYPTDQQSMCPPATNTIPLTLTYAEIGSIEYLFDNINAMVVGFNSQFPTIQSFYDFLTLNGINIIDCGSSIIQQKISSLHSIKVQPKIVTNQPTKFNSSQMKMLEIKKSLGNKNIYNKTNEEIGFTIGNVGFNSSSTAVVIEIKVEGSTTFLDNSIVELHYNPATFGTNISSGVSYSLGSNFATSGVYGSSGVSDYNDSTLTFLITADYDPSTRTQITTTAQTLVTITIPLSSANSCKYYPNFNVINLSGLVAVSYFTNTANATTSNAIKYSKYNSGSSNSGPTCIPVINSLSITTPTTGGTGVTLNIYGSDFGTSNGSIFMKNADCGTTDSISNGPINIPIDQYDIRLWTNTLITINIPSISDHGWDSGTFYIRRTPGTGNIIVKDQWGLKSVDYAPVTIRYSVYNESKGSGTGYYKNNQFLFSANSDSIYHFKLNSNITDAGMINCIKAAFHKWTCMTGVGFVLDAGTVSNNADSDGVNVITLSTITDQTKIGYTFSRVSRPCSTGPTIPFSTAEIDISINNYFVTNNRFTYDTLGTATIYSPNIDFFSFILHELGHAHLLRHVAVASNDVMFWAQPPRPTAPADRQIHFNTNNYNGGTYIVTNSMTQNYGMSCAFNIPLKKFGNPCGPTTSVNEISSVKGILNAYPNPFNDAFEIQFTSKETQEEAQIIIYNSTGQEIRHLKNISLTVGDNSIKVDNFIYPNGLYLVLLKTKEGTFFTKEVCVK